MTQHVPQFLGNVRRKRGQHHYQRLINLAGAALHAGQLIDTNHESGYRRVVTERLNIAAHLLDEFVNRLERLLVGFLIGENHVITLEEECPQALQESAHTLDAVGVPRLAGLDGTQEHLIQAQRVGTIFFHDIIGINDVEHRLGHLLDSPAADVLAVLEDKLGILELGAPLAEFFDVKGIKFHNVDIHVDGRHVILVLEVVGYELVGILDAINEVAAALNHALVDEFAERLSLAYIPVVIEELVPESAVDQVTRSMLGTTNIKVYLAPIIIGLVRDKCLVVVRVHVAQIVGRRAGKARHSVQLQRITVFGHPVLGAAQGRLTRLGGQEFVHLGQDERQFALVERLRLVVLVIVDGERLAPVALTAEDGVAQAVVHFHVADA